MSNYKLLYRVIDFDKREFFKQFAQVLIVAIGVTVVNQIFSASGFAWINKAESSLLSYVTPILTGLYFAILIAVFLTGSEAWKTVVKAARTPGTPAKQKNLMREALAVSSDPFLAYGLTSVWIAMALTGIFLYFPIEVCWLLTTTLTITGMLTRFAFDYWGFENGIKRVELIKK